MSFQSQYIIFQKNGESRNPPYIYSCVSIPIYSSNRYITLHKQIIQNEIIHDENYADNCYEDTNKNKKGINAELIITYEKTNHDDIDESSMKFIRGFLYYKNVEYIIESFIHFLFLKYEKINYMNISFCNCEFELPFII
jgi:hypothetical protein